MTDAVIEVGGARIVQRDDKHEDAPKRDKEKRQQHQQLEDCIDISEEARNRASGKTKKTILEYLEEGELE
jgi:hypothetical protein